MGDGPSRQDLRSAEFEALARALRRRRRDLPPDTIAALTAASEVLAGWRAEVRRARPAPAPTAARGLLRRTS